MDQNQIEDLVRRVMIEIQSGDVKTGGQAQAASGESAATGETAVSEDGLPDLGSDEIKYRIGVPHPKNPDVLAELRKNTGTRVAGGRTGPRPRTLALLRFLADHSRSKDTVLKEVPTAWIEKTGLFEVKTEITDKDVYLTRPDMGRRLSDEAIATLKEKCKKNPQAQVVVSDGLSTDALTVNYDELLPPLMKGLQNAGIDVGTPFFVRYGRVKVEDQIGELLDAHVVILLIGERPGLGQSESLSCYMVYKPTTKTVEANRTCISNIHHAGTPPVEAAAVIVDLAKKMLEKKASGIALNG